MRAVAVLEKPGVAEPRWSAELLLAEATGKSRAWLYAHPEHTVSARSVARFKEWLHRRRRHEPVWYILGRAEFYGLEFRVNRHVLIPRNETELLVETALQMQAGPLIADIATGSGCVGICVAKSLPQATVYATDSSSAALRLAKANAGMRGVADRVVFLRGDWLEPLPVTVNTIIANPPYVSAEEMKRLPREVRDYEPREALFGGEDGLDGIRAILQEAPRYLLPGGSLLMEISPPRARRTVALARRSFPAAEIGLLKDYSGRNRVLCVQTHAAGKAKGRETAVSRPQRRPSSGNLA